jgi:hypothetical protein
MPIKIDYTNGNIDNSTIALENAQTMIEAQTVPTVINGIATATSIIIGFGGAIIGLFIRDFFQDTKTKEILIAFFALPFTVSIVLLNWAYNYLAMGGQGFLDIARRNALDAFVTALFLLLFLFLFFAYVGENKESIKKEDTEKKKDSSTTNNESMEIEKKSAQNSPTT